MSFITFLISVIILSFLLILMIVFSLFLHQSYKGLFSCIYLYTKTNSDSWFSLSLLSPLFGFSSLFPSHISDQLDLVSFYLPYWEGSIRTLIFSLISFLSHTFNTINFHLSSVLAIFYKFWCVIFSSFHLESFFKSLLWFLLCPTDLYKYFV